MFQLALRQLQLDRLRTALTAVALGAVIAVILVLEGFEQGQYFQIGQIVLHREADLVATQSGVTNFIAVRSSIPQLSRMDVEAVEGVAEAHPITAIPIIYNRNNIRTPVYVLVYDVNGGPSSIIEGREIQHGKEIVIDVALAKKYNLKPGDTFNVTDFEFIVAGVTREAAFMMPFAFINYDGMIDLFIESEIAPDISTFPLLSYMLIELEAGAKPEQVREQIEMSVEAVDVVTPKELAGNDINMAKVFFGPIMGLLVSIGYIIGMLMVGLIMYADIRSRLRSFAVLKALGFSFGKLFSAVLQQSLLLLFIAIPIGVLLAIGIAAYIETAAPVYYLRLFAPTQLIQTFFAGCAFALLGALIPLRLIQRSDPAMIFQEV